MKRIFLSFLLVGLAAAAAAVSFSPQDFEKKTASGVEVRYRAGTLHLSGGIEFLQELDRELSRIFLAPPGAGACRIIVDRARSPREISCQIRSDRHEIYIGESFVRFQADPVYRGELAARILCARFGLKKSAASLPGWMICGLEGIRQNQQSSGKILRNMRYYPVLRGLLGAGIMPDFRAFMQLDKWDFSASIQPAMNEFGRLLLESFARISSVQNRALGDYTADVLTGIRPESESYRIYLQPAMIRFMGGTGNDQEFFRAAAEQAAFNPRSPRPAEALLDRLPEALKFSVSRQDGKKKVIGSIQDLPLMFAVKNPHRQTARRQILLKLQYFQRELPADAQPAGNDLILAVRNLAGEDPRKERILLDERRNHLVQALQKQKVLERYLLDAEDQYVIPLKRFQADLTVISKENEFLSRDEKDYFNRIEMQYLEN